MLWQLFMFSFQSQSTWMTESSKLWLMSRSCFMSNSMSLMEGICNLEKILSQERFSSSFISISTYDLLLLVSQTLVISLISLTGLALTASSPALTYLKRMSKFFWMNEQNLFLILFSGRPGKYLLIYDHLLPILLYSSKILWSSSSLQSSFFILGSSLLMNLSLICLPFFEPNISERSFQFFPYFLISFLMVSSSSEDHILWFLPNCDNRLYLCKHWFSFLSFINAAISAHFLGNLRQSSRSWLSSQLVHVLTRRLVT